MYEYFKFVSSVKALTVALIVCIGAEPGVARQREFSAKPTESLPELSKSSRFCSFLGLPQSGKLFRDRLPLTLTKLGGVGSIERLVARIVDYSGVEASFKVFSGRVLNAAAVLDGNQTIVHRYIVYHPLFMSYLNRRFKAQPGALPWASIGVFAHEVGHHLAGHGLEANNQRYFELQADWYSGYILRKMGSTQAAAQRVLRSFWQPVGSLTHPGSKERLAAISDGWREADCEAGGANCTQPMPEFHADENKQTRDRKKSDETKQNQTEQSKKKIVPSMMCTLHGEQLVVSRKNNVYWLRHYEERRVAIGTYTTAGITGCRENIKFALTSNYLQLYCLNNQKLSLEGDGDTEVGDCRRCAGGKSFCPSEL